MEDMFRVGVIANTHGIRGEVKVYPTTDDVTRYKKLKEVLLDTGKEYKTLEIASTRFFKNLVIVKFKGIDNINDIEQYKGHDLYVTRENAIPLEEGEYYLADIIDAKVVTEEGEDFGILKDVLETGANSTAIRFESALDDPEHYDLTLSSTSSANTSSNSSSSKSSLSSLLKYFSIT